HAAYWKYRVLRHLAADPPGSFGEAGSNFFPRPRDGEATKSAWSKDRERLRGWHARLVEAVRAFDPERLGEVAYDRNTFCDLILGAAAHDVYHAGQIRLLRVLQAGGGS
ncbi:MAG: DinB family protein, partial [Holophagales bacterium]|nr:DinB family protein [Holophagales bacterium]